MKHLRALAVFCVTTFVMIASSHAEERALPRTVKVLTIGNSFSENACKYLKEIGKDQGVEIIIGTANIGGCPLEKHARLARESDADPSLKPYTTKHDGKTTKINLQDALKAEEWDFVTIQQYSLHSYRPETYINNYFGPNNNQPADNVTILATSMLPPEAPKAEPVAWCIERPNGGRGYAIVMPHFYKNWSDDNLRTFILNGIVWSAKREVPEAGVKSTLTDLTLFKPASVNVVPKRPN